MRKSSPAAPKSSKARIEANRANARKSTGPVTATGKANSSQNAEKHGLNSTGIFVQPHETGAFTELETDLAACYRPGNEAERQLFLLILHAAWNLRRCRLLEAALQNEANAAGVLDPLLDDTLGRKAERIQRYARSAERTHHAAIRELSKLQTEQSYRNQAFPEVADEFPVTSNQKSVQPQLIADQAAIERQNRSATTRQTQQQPQPEFDASLLPESIRKIVDRFELRTGPDDTARKA